MVRNTQDQLGRVSGLPSEPEGKGEIKKGGKVGGWEGLYQEANALFPPVAFESQKGKASWEMHFCARLS